MSIVAIARPTGVFYVASISQKGVKVSIGCSNRMEAITRCWHEFMYYVTKN